MVFANETKINQVVLNLFLNAVDAASKEPTPQINFKLYTENFTKIILILKIMNLNIKGKSAVFI